MPYTFGGGTGDDINWAAQDGGIRNNAALVCGWFYPTTLTAGRTLWSFGNVTSVQIHSTTSELQLNIDHTTDSTFTTTGVGLATNTWTFVACLGTSNNTGPADAWRVWSGTITTPPVECTVTAGTSPSGNATASTAFTIGNKGTGTVAFQGDIAEIGYITAPQNAASNFFQLAASGAITQAEADFVRDRFVIPAWRGESWQFQGARLGVSGVGSVIEAAHISLIGLPQAIRAYGAAAVASGLTPTINGATVSLNGPPRPNIGTVIYPATVLGV